jgi:hypothetical protein
MSEAVTGVGGGGCMHGEDMTGARSACENSADIMILFE